MHALSVHFHFEASVSLIVYWTVQEGKNIVPDIFMTEHDFMSHCFDVDSKGFHFFCLKFNPSVNHTPKPMTRGSLEKEVSALGSTSSISMLATIGHQWAYGAAMVLSEAEQRANVVSSWLRSVNVVLCLIRRSLSC